jgi:N-acyl homoserine lactone hydrolase
MQIVGVSTGRVRPKRAMRGVRRYLPGGWSDATQPVNVFAVVHPDGVLLFDTGQSSAAARPGFLPRWHPYLRLARFELTARDEAVSQLRRLGLEPSAVRWVVLSHLHTDHVGGLEAFSRAQVVVSGAEWDLARGPSGRLRGYVRRQWPTGLVPRLTGFDGPPVGPFSCSEDLAGDGRLVLVPTPGHTKGHMSLLARADDGTYLLAGDLVHTAAELESVAPEIAAYCRANSVVVLATHDQAALDRVSGPSVARS